MNVVDKRVATELPPASSDDAGQEGRTPATLAPAYQRTSGKHKCRYCGRRDVHEHDGLMPRVAVIEAPEDITQPKHPLAGIPLTRKTRRANRIKTRREA